MADQDKYDQDNDGSAVTELKSSSYLDISGYITDSSAVDSTIKVE